MLIFIQKQKIVVSTVSISDITSKLIVKLKSAAKSKLATELKSAAELKSAIILISAAALIVISAVAFEIIIFILDFCLNIIQESLKIQNNNIDEIRMKINIMMNTVQTLQNNINDLRYDIDEIKHEM